MMNDQLLASYDYHLPPELIAQTPVTPRDSSRLLVVNSATTQVHSQFRDLTEWLLPGDLLVFNNTRVIPARLYGRKSTGAPVEILLLEEKSPFCWLALVKPGKRFTLGSQIEFADESGQIKLMATVLERDEETGGRLLKFEINSHELFWQILEQVGLIPFPPYVTESEAQPSQYQTVYAQEPGAVAAPTAGLHFTEDLLERLSQKGIGQAYLTLHVGVGTFRPVEISDITQHKMHQEWVEVPEITVNKIVETKKQGGRVIAVGTTVVRSLEGAAKVAKSEGKDGLIPFRAKTDLFIYPGYKWQVVEGMITNFHLPCSSLLMLVSALIGRERLMSLYQEAIKQKYRFYSFGDGMLILPEGKSNK
ncbi:tRNA preQ1(34) S-adenosylmethionine ribosyltransferase-isomerase QueA [Aphanothece sacrum]|nr:tRNA preQ1(34) S-adenosylmethionine ribosyltransferase-isomerase QueA [Aphanothece sacrum]GBF83210.1 S-adenosylmethionine:tRNA ribosyltransferase-isomerase [Aphanothece sacrum FPU3]